MINVAVTGSGGFIGSHLLKSNANDIQFHPIPFDRLISSHNSNLFEFKIDHVIHLAAKTFVPDSWINPSEFYQLNVMGTQKVLDFCRENTCGMTYISSYVYGVPKYLPINEQHDIVPNTPYNHSKLLGEELCKFYHDAYKVDVTVIRPFNIYGSNQNNVFLIPKIIKQIFELGEITLESLEPKRDYLFVEDFIDLLLATIQFKGFEIINAGYGSSYSVKEIAQTISELAGKKNINIISQNKTRNNEVMNVIADIEKAKKVFKWIPKTNIREGLKKVLDNVESTKNDS